MATTKLDREVAAIQARIVADTRELAEKIEAQLANVRNAQVVVSRADAVAISANLRTLANLCGGYAEQVSA